MQNKKNLNLTDEEKKQCDAIIRSAATAAEAAGTNPDIAVLDSIHMKMIATLGKKVFGLEIPEAAAEAIITRAYQPFARNAKAALEEVPGHVPNTPMVAELTEAIGWMAAKEFSINKSSYKQADGDASSGDDATSVPADTDADNPEIEGKAPEN